MIRYINYGDVLGEANRDEDKFRSYEYYSFYELSKSNVIALSHLEVYRNDNDELVESRYMSSYANEYYIFGEDMSDWFFSPETAIGAKYPTKEEETLVIKLYEQYVKDTRDDVVIEVVKIV